MRLQCTARGLTCKMEFYLDRKSFQGNVFPSTLHPTFLTDSMLILVSKLLLLRHKGILAMHIFYAMFIMTSQHDNHCFFSTMHYCRISSLFTICFINLIFYWNILYLFCCVCHIFIFSMIAFATGFVLMCFILKRNVPAI